MKAGQLFVILIVIIGCGCNTRPGNISKTNALNAKIVFVLEYPRILEIRVPSVIGAKVVYDYSDYNSDIYAWNKYQILYNQDDTAILRIITKVNGQDSCIIDAEKIGGFLRTKIKREDINASQFSYETIGLNNIKLNITYFSDGFMAYWCYNKKSYTFFLYKMRNSTLSHSIARAITLDSNLHERSW